jgi:hypothetical protein
MSDPTDEFVQQLVEKIAAAKPPSKRSGQRAMKALAELQAMFQASGISEKEFQADLKRIRKELTYKRYRHLLTKSEPRNDRQG